MYRHDDCMCKPEKEYARAYIIPQKYENLYSIKEGFFKGTIFRDLFRPYRAHDHSDPNEHYYEYKKMQYKR